MLASFLIQQSRTKINIAHFLQAAVNESSTRAVAVAASILVQLFRDRTIVSNSDLMGTMIDDTLPLLDNFSTYEECPFEQLWAILEKAFAKLPTFSLVVDALDECYADADAPNLAKKLQDMSTLSHARIIVLSRHHPSLQILLKNSAKIQMDETTITGDITLFIRQEVKRTPNIRIADELIIQKAKEDAKGMFLWTKLMLQYLQKASTPRMQRDRLQKFPIGLSSIYEKFLNEAGRNIEPEQIILRKSIFMLMVAATSPLSFDDIAVALALDAPNIHPNAEDLLIEPSEQISTLCWPFIKIVDSRVQFIHYSMQEFLLLPANPSCETDVHFTSRESNDYMALKCVFRLINSDARSIQTLESLLRLRLGGETFAGKLDMNELPCTWPFYSYASTNWHLHLTHSTNSFKLLRHVSMLLRGLEFIAWAETFLHDDSDMGPVVDIHTALCAWHSNLSEEQRDCVDISSFMEKPYNDFFARSEIRRRMPDVAYMALRRLGLYHNINGTISGGRTLKDLRKLVAEGFAATLGIQHPLTLKCATDYCIEQMVDDERELPAAESRLLTIMAQQQEVLGYNASDSYYTQHITGLAMHYQTRNDEAITHLKQSCNGLERILGPNHHHFQVSRLYYTHALQAKSVFEKATRIYEEVWSRWSQLHGTEHPLSTMAQCNLGVAYRKLKRFEAAEKHLMNSLVERQRVFGKCTVTVDSSIQLALLYRDMGRNEKAHACLNLAEDLGLNDCGFERYCQVQHLRSLLCLDCDNKRGAKKLLEALVVKSNQHPPNRAIMWARLALANLLRHYGHGGKALSLFSNMVRVASDNNREATCITPRDRLRAAEQFLKIARKSGLQVAEQQLRLQGLEWKSPQALWIIFGGPAAEVF